MTRKLIYHWMCQIFTKLFFSGYKPGDDDVVHVFAAVNSNTLAIEKSTHLNILLYYSEIHRPAKKPMKSLCMSMPLYLLGKAK